MKAPIIRRIPRAIPFRAVPFLAIVILTSCVSTTSWGSYGTDLDALTGDQWVRDINALEVQLTRRHPNPFHTTGESVFRDHIEDIRSMAAGQRASAPLSDAVVTGIYRALASLDEGHTTVNASPVIQYPVLIRRFRSTDGGVELRVAYSDESLSEIRGRRVVAIGGRDPEEVLATVSSVASAELPTGRVFFGQRLMTDPRIMRGLGIATPDGLEITVALPDGERDVLLEPRPTSEITLRSPDLSVTEESAHASRSISFGGSGPYWYEMVGTTLYFRYNFSTTNATEMMDEIIGRIDAGDVERLILDLRFNGGGNSWPGTQFVSRLAERAIGQDQGRFYVLISEGTFSSAIMTAVDAMAETKAIFAGTPMSTPVDSWGEVRRFTLPESGLVIGHSTRYWDYTTGKELRLRDGVLIPDPGWELIWTFDEWVQQHDPALERILASPLPR